MCGVRTPEVAEAAIAAGAAWLGWVLVPRSPRWVDDHTARALAGAVAGRADLVGVMVDAGLEECDEAAKRYRLSAIQLHGVVPPHLAENAAVPVIRALNVGDARAAYREQWWPDCLVLLDAAPEDDAALPGGTGRRLDLSTAAVLAGHRDIVLAGGIGPGNVAEAITAVRPRGVDASSGLESSPGVKNAGLVEAYVRTARRAFDGLRHRRVA